MVPVPMLSESSPAKCGFKNGNEACRKGRRKSAKVVSDSTFLRANLFDMFHCQFRGHSSQANSHRGIGSSNKLRGLSVRAQARRISIPLSLSAAGVSSFVSSPGSAMIRGAFKRSALSW